MICGKTDKEIERRISSYNQKFYCAGIRNEELAKTVVVKEGYWKRVTNTPMIVPPMVYVQPEGIQNAISRQCLLYVAPQNLAAAVYRL